MVAVAVGRPSAYDSTRRRSPRSPSGVMGTDVTKKSGPLLLMPLALEGGLLQLAFVRVLVLMPEPSQPAELSEAAGAPLEPLSAGASLHSLHPLLVLRCSPRVRDSTDGL